MVEHPNAELEAAIVAPRTPCLFAMGPFVIALAPSSLINSLTRYYALNLGIWNAWSIIYAVFGCLIAAIHANDVNAILNGDLGSFGLGPTLGATGPLDGGIETIGLISMMYAICILLIPMVAAFILRGQFSAVGLGLSMMVSGITHGISHGAEMGAAAGPAGAVAGGIVGAGMGLNLIEDLLPHSAAWKQAAQVLLPGEDIAIGRPITPLHGGHVGLLCTAGLLNGVFGQGEQRHVARWRSVKQVTKKRAIRRSFADGRSGRTNSACSTSREKP